MNKNRQADLPKGVWKEVGDVDRIMETQDGFHVHIHHAKTGWTSQITDQETKKFRHSNLSYLTEAEAEDASLKVIAVLRQRRQEQAEPQGKLDG